MTFAFVVNEWKPSLKLHLPVHLSLTIYRINSVKLYFNIKAYFNSFKKIKREKFPMKKIMYLGAVLLALVFGCSDNTSNRALDTPNSQDTISSENVANSISEDRTKEVLDHHWKAFMQNNLDEVMADYTEESVLITPDETFKGLDAIRKNFESAYRKFPKNKTTFQLNKSIIDRDVAYILWQAKTPTFNLTYATDTFIIRNGKIIRQTYAGVANNMEK
jgi:hypothetical protein